MLQAKHEDFPPGAMPEPHQSSPFSATSPATTLQAHACVRCQNRKVKCDKLMPKCSKCIKSGVECEYRAPAPPRRGKRKLSETDLQSKLRHYEGLLRKNGLPVDQASPLEPAARYPDVAFAPLNGNNGYAHPVATEASTHIPHRPLSERQYGHQNNSLWQDLKDHQRENAQASSDDEAVAAAGTDSHPPMLMQSKSFTHGSEMLLGLPSSNEDHTLYLPAPENCLRLWQAYQENFNPLSHLVHVPSIDPLIAEAMSPAPRLSDSGRLMLFAIFAASVSTLSKRDCELLFAQEKEVLLDRYRLATKQALVKASFISTPDIAVLQAYVIYLISIHQAVAPETLWALSGVAVRIGLRLGVQKKDLAQLTPFEAEIRTRLWWQICIYDTQLAEVAGQSALRVDLLGDLEMPLNVNDSDLSPDMTQHLQDREGATEMMFSRIRYEFATFLRNGGLKTFFDTEAVDSSDMRAAMAEKDKVIDELEKRFENGYLRYCDPLVPLQFVSTILARCIIARLRLMAHHPRQYPDEGASLPTSEKEMLFTLSLKALEYDTIVESTPSLRGFTWHTKNQVQWLALVHVLNDLRKRTSGLDCEKAWRQVEQIYDTHPQMMETRQRPIFHALASLVLSAWKRREAEHMRRYRTSLAPLGFILELRSSRRLEKREQDDVKTSQRHGNQFDPVYDTEQTASTPVADPAPSSSIAENLSGDIDSSNDFSPIDWNEWDDLVRDFDTSTNQGMFG